MRIRSLLFQWLPGGWMLLAIVLLLGAPAVFLNDAAVLAALPMVVCAALLLGRRISIQTLFARENHRNLWLSLGATIVFFLLLSLPNLLSCALFSEAGLSAIWWPFRWIRLLYLAWNWTGFLLGYAAAVFLCAFAALRWSLKERVPMNGDRAVGKIRFLGLYRPILLLAAVTACTLLSSTQSLVIGDAGTIWGMAQNQEWRAWHTAGYLLFVRLCQWLGGTQRAVTLVQAVAYVYINNYILSFFISRGMTRRACCAYVIAAVVTFLPIYFLQVMIKDVVFALSLLAFGIGVLRIANDAESGKTRVVDWIWITAFGLCTCLFRHAGFLPVICTLPVLLYRLLKRRRKAAWGVVAAGACIAAVYMLLIDGLFFGMLHGERNPEYIQYSAPMTMIGAVAASGAPIAPEDRAVMEQIMPVEDWAACYTKYFADTISRPYGRIGKNIEKVEQFDLGDDLLRLNAHFLIYYPRIYLTAFFDLNSLMWEIATPSDGYVRSYLCYPQTPIPQLAAKAGVAAEGFEAYQRIFKQPEGTTFNGFAPLINRYAEFLYGVPVLRSLLWRGGFSNLCLLFAAVLLLRKRRAMDLMGLIPITVVTLGMLFSMPAQEVRYIFPNLEYAVLFLPYAVLVPKGKAQ